MSIWFPLSLSVIVAVIFASRFIVAALPVRRLARRMVTADAGMAAVGLLGLTFHCGAMFFVGLVEPLPGADTVIDDIRALGLASIVWYVVPALMVLVGFRGQQLAAVAAVGLVLVGVGVTMYDGGPLQVHLGAIIVAVTALAAVVATFVVPPWRRDTSREAG